MDKIEEVVKQFQEKKGSPPNFPEIFKYILENKLMEDFFSENEPRIIFRLKSPAFATDRFYTTKCLNYWSLEKWNYDYKTYMERFHERWAVPYGYTQDHLKRVRPGSTTLTVDFGELFDTLASDDASLLEKNKWMFNDLNYPKFLKRKGYTVSGKTVENTGNLVSYSTYPRVGNSFLRKYL